MDAGIPVLQPERLGSAAREAASRYPADLLVVAAFGRIFGPKFLSLFPMGGINVHPSLLPRHRGPTPIQATILSGDKNGGVSIQYLAPQLDSGDILAQEAVPLEGSESYPDLEKRFSELGGELLRRVLVDLEARTAVSYPQNHDEATYCPMIHKDDGRIDWSRRALEIDRMARAYDPWPGLFTYLNGERIAVKELALVPPEPEKKVTATEGSAGPEAGSRPEEGPKPGCVVGIDKGLGILVQTGQHFVALRRLQPAGRKAMDHLAFLNGYPAVREACFE